MRKMIVALACLCALFAAGAQASPPVEHVAGVAPLARDAFASIDADQFDADTFTAADGTTLPYRVLRPSHLEGGETYPLVVQFHGSGGIGTDNARQLDRLARSWATPEVRERYQAYILVPQFPVRSANYGPASPDQKSEASPALAAAVELVRAFSATHPVDPARIYASGFSMGGSAAWLAPTLAPSLFAAIVPISGIAPADTHAATFKDLPVLVVHGNTDDENPITADRRFFAAIRNAGGRSIRFREYEGLAHQPPGDIHPGTGWRDWLFQQKRL
ncbi:hypothetical protein CQ393_00885 [Stenotrophomonas sp. MYb238]|uniref:carboxylesterase family protein n=1 Tax=Stenotrophomonas sp. MYb238 TaxID=2040281 RepID=UPI0012921C89|nr:PHB depolymerase family esterase [Stenotrophomonas sp. MYb238]MQP74449.1 hypothetical protein [Stenotrophomonas sp. MYb238]